MEFTIHRAVDTSTRRRDPQFIRLISDRSPRAGNDKQARRHSKDNRKKKRKEKKIGKQKSKGNTHGIYLIAWEGDAFEYVDWVVAHKRLLEALWDSAIERGGEGDARMGGERGKENAPKRLGTRRRRCAEEGRVEEGETREEPRCSGLARRGLRLLLAALRQLGGVRRGIEIANAHYGYFPIEGRIPLSLSLSPPSPGLLPRFSLFLLPLAFLPPLALFELSPFHSLHRFIFSLSLSLSLFLRVSFYLSHISISVFVLLSHLFLPSHIAQRFFSPSRALFFSRIFSLSFFISQKRKRTRKSVDSRSHFLVFHSCLFL